MRCNTWPVTLSVLVVDDHSGFRHEVRLLLEHAGYEVVGEAADAASAIATARRLSPDIVLLDVQLPDADGFTVARTLTAAVDAPAVILISGRDRSDYDTTVDACGAAGFVPKADLTAERFRQALGGDVVDV
jgi:DNA-binding NarL/FixJ family response regulator